MAAPKMSAEWDEFAEKSTLPEIPTTVEGYRAHMADRGLKGQTFLDDPAFSVLVTGVDVTNTHITLPEVPNVEFPVRIYRPAEMSDERLPVMLYFHGGYWCGGDANSEDLGCRAIIARGTKLVIMSFSYRLIPDVPWHTVLSDAEYSMKWMTANAASIGSDTTKGFLVGGADAGAHIAAACAIRARDRHPKVKLTGQNLIVPALMAWPDDKIPAEWQGRLTSHIEMAHAPILNVALYETLVAALNVPEKEKRKGENFPMWGSLKGLPPAYIPVDECDPIRDHGFLYAELLQEAGVLTRTDFYRGMPNMFVQFPGLPTTLIAGGQLSSAMAWLLQERK